MGKMEKAVASAETGAAKRPFRMKIRWATRADAAALRAIYSYYVENTTVSFEYEAPSVAEMERRIAEVEGVYPFLVCVVEDENGEIGEDAEDLRVDVRNANVKIDKNDSTGKIRKNGKTRQDDGMRENDKDRTTVAIARGDKSSVGNERIVGYALARRAFERAAYAWTAETAVYVDRDWRRRGIGEALYSALIEILEAQGIRTLYAVVVAENKASVEFHRRVGFREFATFKSAGWKFGRWLDVVWLERTLGVWRDDEARKAEKSGGNKTAEAAAGGRTTKPAPSPVWTLAELSVETFDVELPCREV